MQNLFTNKTQKKEQNEEDLQKMSKDELIKLLREQ